MNRNKTFLITLLGVMTLFGSCSKSEISPTDEENLEFLKTYEINEIIYDEELTDIKLDQSTRALRCCYIDHRTIEDISDGLIEEAFIPYQLGVLWGGKYSRNNISLEYKTYYSPLPLSKPQLIHNSTLEIHESSCETFYRGISLNYSDPVPQGRYDWVITMTTGVGPKKQICSRQKFSQYR